MNTEDKFYFGKHVQPERFARATDAEIEHLLLEAESLIDDGFVSRAIPYLRRASNSIDTKTSTRLRDILESLMKEAKVRFSRLGQPERFAAPSPKEQQQIRAASRPPASAIAQLKRVVAEYKKRADKGERLDSDDYWGLKAVLDAAISGDRSGLMSRARGLDTIIREEIPQAVWHWAGGEVLRWSKPGQPERFAESLQAKWDGRQYRVFLPSGAAWYSEDGKRWTLKHGEPVPASEVRKYDIRLGTGFSRPGQPEKFDASSLDRGSFAEASTSPMLGKLLAAKVMPEGGWRAVQSGSDTLVISFEDADLARDFGRRAATKGYNATSPVQAIGRYWNVEVKNGK
jgi:ribosomal protein L22